MENGYIAINIVFNENTPIAINELISEAFSLNAENNWIILNSSINKQEFLFRRSYRYIHLDLLRLK